MRFKTPAFWYRQASQPPAIAEQLLAPFSTLYALGHGAHQTFRKARRVPVPVLCVGNLIAGGAGKTIAAQSLMRLIKREGLAQNPFFLTRGYGGHAQGPLQIKQETHDYHACGDEALLLARRAPTVMAKDRYAGALYAHKQGADFLLLDDGLQNPALHKDLNIIVISGEMGFGNERLLPAGPLREPLKTGLRKAEAFILIGKDKRGLLEQLPDTPLFRAEFSTDKTDLPPKDRPYIAFAGMGYPDKFFSYLKHDLGYTVLKEISFADHYPYNEQDLEELGAMAKTQNAALITTEKDFVRLPKSLNLHVHTLPVALSWHDEAAISAFLKNHLSAP